ncbi:MAG: hypothetical protein BA870_01385 [Desulfuromonadales bacterium C00003094]|jgi:hypothetical protein|nr:MAG: hypothetical protein BA870_01385 [Desulfuromonadales bacterium C00003094]OEU76398.1 MAG: hypothetical protein BA869_00050 [Desulfuromonadales bacterium C00003107]
MTTHSDGKQTTDSEPKQATFWGLSESVDWFGSESLATLDNLVYNLENSIFQEVHPWQIRGYPCVK